MSTSLPIHNCYGAPSKRRVSFIGLALVIEERCAVLGDGGYDLRFILSIEGRRGVIDLTGREGAHSADLPSAHQALDAIAAAFSRPLLVTRHPGLVEVLWDDYSLRVDAIPHISAPGQVRGRVTVGVLPNHLAALSLVHVEIPLGSLPAELRNKELDAAQVRQYAGPPRIYAVDGI